MAQTTSVLWSVDQGLGEKAKEQARQNIGAASEKLTEVVNNHTEKIEANTEKIEANTTEIGQIKVDVADIESSLLNKKDKQQLKSFNGSSKQTIKNISQTENGELNVEFEDIYLPHEAHNVNITSEDKSIKVSETTDAQTNTKTFDISVSDSVKSKIKDITISNDTLVIIGD